MVDSPSTVGIDENGCNVIGDNIPTQDTDGDGIVDAIDQCSTTPSGIKVFTTGVQLRTSQRQVISQVIFQVH